MDAGTLKGKRVAIYARSCSAMRQASTDAQVLAAMALIERHDGSVPDDQIFLDEAISGETTERPGLAKLLMLVVADALDCVRVTRDPSQAVDILRQLHCHGVRLLTVDGLGSSPWAQTSPLH